MDIEQARFNMIEQQIRPWDVSDQAVLDLILQTPREKFVPEKYQHLAFSDTNIPLPHAQVMMKPIIEARMLQALNIQSHERVLEIGTGSGYVTALLAQLATSVSSEEIHADLSQQASEQLQALNINNVDLEVTDSLKNRKFQNRFDVIVVTGSLPKFDSIFQEQLEIGGRLFIVAGEAPVMEALLITRLAEEKWQQTTILETVLPALIGATEINKFVL